MTGRAAIYSRVSSQTQASEDRVSLGEQEEACRAYCEQRGYEVAATYQEIGTGASRRRPQFQAMLSEARAGHFDVLIAWKLDRLSRGVLPVGDLMAAVQPYGVGVEAVKDVVDMKYLALLASVAQLELDALRERTTMGRRGRAKAGRIPVKRLPYGYRVVDGLADVDEYPARIVQRVYQMVLDGHGLKVISGRLNAEGIATPSGGSRWLPGILQRILADETYCGEWRYGKKRVRRVEGGRVVSRTDRAEQIGIPVPALVDRSAWEKVQALKLQRRKRSGGIRKYSYLLSALLRCSECGQSLSGLARAGGRLRYYVCGGIPFTDYSVGPTPISRQGNLRRSYGVRSSSTSAIQIRSSTSSSP